MRQILALSGPIAVGKSSFAEALKQIVEITSVSTREWICRQTGAPNDRQALQIAGEKLDISTNGKWVSDAVLDAAEKVDKSSSSNSILLVDSVRIGAQVEHLKERFGEHFIHIHLHASDEILSARYLQRDHSTREFANYAQVKENCTEGAIDELATLADLVLDADYSAPDTLAMTAMTWWGKKEAPPVCSSVDVVVGGQYGSEGKGNICASLAREYDVLMRIGGPNAGHLVKEPLYKYVQLPSGTGSNENAKIFIGAGSTIWLPQLLQEMMDHKIPASRLSIDPQAMIIDDEDKRVEAQNLTSIASTKQGVGSAIARKILNRGKNPIFGPPVTLAGDVKQLNPYVRDVRAELDRCYANDNRILLEGTQGTSLSIHHGIWPSVTSRETSAAGCIADAGIAPNRVRRVIMVVRTYPIRVGGTSGWMGREIDMETVSKRSRLDINEFDKVERGTISGTKRRIAEFDWAQLRRSAVLNGATHIAVTFADYLGLENRKANNFDELNEETRKFITKIEQVTGIPVSLVSKEFAKDGVINRGNWE